MTKNPYSVLSNDYVDGNASVRRDLCLAAETDRAPRPRAPALGAAVLPAPGDTRGTLQAAALL